MPDNWYYEESGRRAGPVTSKELVALARDGKLRPTDLVWKEGMKEKKPAGKVKGLFPTNTATPPPLPPPLLPPTPKATPPDLPTAAEGLFGAVATAAQQAVAKATEAAKQAQETLPQPTSPVPLSGRQKRGILIAGSVLAVGTVVVVVAAVIALQGNGRGQPTNNLPKRVGEFVELRSFAEVPLPVQEAADAGHEVWELTGWHQESLQSYCLDASLYVVLEHGTLARLIEKQHHKKGSVLAGKNGKDREVFQWAEQSLDKLPAEESKFEYHWRLQVETPTRYVLSQKSVLETTTEDATTTKTFTVVIDDKVKEGYWQGERNSHYKFRGRMAKFPDKHTSEKVAGGAVRLLGRRSPPRPAAQPPKADPKPDQGNAGAVAPPEPLAVVPKDAGPPAPARPPMQESKPAVPAVPEPKAVVPAKPKLIPVYKVVFPGDVLLTTNEEEVKNIVKVYPGEFKGDKGHWTGTFGFAYAERQEGTVLLRRYLVGNKRVFTTRKLDNPNYKEEGMGAWVSEKERDGTTLQLGFFRKKDAAKEYGSEKTTEFFGKLGYSPSELKFYMFDKPELP
ncbi:MAG: DUF4339 domain-containing protein [Gemmataceae bacterium]|nr:DUF4339 domain-containing protein [Gemmataceae bacterium]